MKKPVCPTCGFEYDESDNATVMSLNFDDEIFRVKIRCPECFNDYTYLLNTRSDIYKKILAKFGLEPQLTMVIEECSEITKEICKYHRHKESTDKIVEEAADVYIMMLQMREINRELFDKTVKDKLIRVRKKIE
jgi:NTP pyrophosphatase (non-canonical NTP hydrolase)/rubredoxin